MALSESSIRKTARSVGYLPTVNEINPQVKSEPTCATWKIIRVSWTEPSQGNSCPIYEAYPVDCYLFVLTLFSWIL